jgi:hypothetical protein
MYAVKVKEPGMKRWAFLATGGHLTTRRVHAQVAQRADATAVAVIIARKYPDTRAKVVRLGR